LEYFDNYYKTNKDFTESGRALIFYKSKFTQNVFQNFLETINQISNENTHLNFVIRPHPEESLNKYFEYFKNNHNIFIARGGSVIPWIISSKLVIHYDCTTGLEAALSGKTVVSYTPFKDEQILAWLPVLVSIEISDPIELSKYIRNFDFKSQLPYTIPDNINNTIHSFINNVFEESIPLFINNFSKITLNSIISTVFYLENIKIHLKKIIIRISNTRRNKFSDKKFEFVSKKESLHKLLILKDLNNTDCRFNVTQIIKNELISISSDSL